MPPPSKAARTSPLPVGSEQEWTTAILQASSEIDTDTASFLCNEIISANFRPSPHSDSDSTQGSDESESDRLSGIIGHHLQDLLGLTDIQLDDLIHSILSYYTSPPQPSFSAPAHVVPDTCELCDRPMFLTVHHLFPRSEHAHLLVHPPDELPKLGKEDLLVTYRAYLCRPCHSAVHRIASNRELAERYWTIEKLMDNEDVRRWAEYAGKQKVKGGNMTGMGLKYKR